MEEGGYGQMEVLLDYFTIDGAFGGNQDWFTNIVMHIGGCGAAAACDSCIYFAKHMGMEELYPYDIKHLNKKDYKDFSQIMKPYIHPRVNGVKKLEWYIEGFEKYLSDVSARTGTRNRIRMKGFAGEHPFEEAETAVKSQIDAGLPIPYLMLRHRMPEKYKDFIWHWFLVVGYEQSGRGLRIIAATYGEEVRLPLKELWDTGYEEKGGLILYDVKKILYEKSIIRYNK